MRLVDRHQPRQGIWRARRRRGEVVGTGYYEATTGDIATVAIHLDEASNHQAHLAARLCERALHLILRRFSGPLGEDLRHFLDGRRIEFLQGHEYLIDLNGEIVSIACDIAPELQVELDPTKDDLVAAHPELLNGFEVLLALGQFYLFEILRSTPPRRALHQVLDIHAQLSRNERERLRQPVAI